MIRHPNIVALSSIACCTMDVISSKDDIQKANFWIACCAELIGTAFLVIFACGTCLHAHDDAKVLTVALGFGFSVTTMVSACMFVHYELTRIKVYMCTYTCSVVTQGVVLGLYNNNNNKFLYSHILVRHQ